MQRISVTVTLNRSTLQFDEAAFQRLEQYLADARQTLAGNPDRDEILADLEQAVADQCNRRFATGATIVTLRELQPALEEVGPVQVPAAAASASTAGASSPPRMLQQVSDGALISGVCQGFARYFGFDVVLLRIVAVLLLFATGGGMILVYLVLMLLMPLAPLERGGKPLRWLPAKCRGLVGFVRGKLGAAAT
jgi:phage shock protein PspC (stress-responsive transcriptional regulator)